MSLRVHQLAKNLGLSSKELIERLNKLHVKVTGHMSAVDEKTAEILMAELKPVTAKPAEKEKPEKAVKKPKPPKEEKKEEEKIVTEKKTEEVVEEVLEEKIEVISKEKTIPKKEVKFPITPKELALKLQIKPSQLISDLIKKRIFVNLNQNLSEDVAKGIAQNYNVELIALPSEEEAILSEHEKIDKSKLILRAPVVTFMGHVDHGKTSLLDFIRKTRVAHKEAGGITQHIGAYQVDFKGGKVTFLDTPGHEAFTAMRARGADVTDVVVLVVAADDGVKPQTIEAIDHAKAAGVPIVVAMNKIDKPQVDIDKTKRQLAELGLTPEDWGGKTITVGVSAKTGEGIDHLLEMLLLEAEMLELRADPTRSAKGIVIESKLTRGSGPVSTVLVQNGTLRVSDIIICGNCFGKVKALVDDKGQRITQAGPATPVEILGLNGIVNAGEIFYVVEDEKKAKEIALLKQHKAKEERILNTVKPKISLDTLYIEIQAGHVKELKLIVKADMQGSVEALVDSLEKLSTEKVKLKVIHAGVGSINESDILLAAASDAIVVGFHVKFEPGVKATASREGVDVRNYSIIYEAVSDIRAAMEGLLDPKINKVFIGRAEVREVFKLSKSGIIAGCMVTKGKIIRGEHAAVYRDKESIFEGRVDSLKHFKNDAKEMTEGSECGISFSSYKALKVGDIIECYRLEKIIQKL
ncbi:MAG: translation initiation factor IF-2 [Candidatus Omnitrophota bacterium]